MKKIISLLLVILFCVGILTGCGKDISNSELKCIESNTFNDKIVEEEAYLSNGQYIHRVNGEEQVSE